MCAATPAEDKTLNIRIPLAAITLAAALSPSANASVSAIGIGSFSPAASLQTFDGPPTGTDVNGLSVGGLSFSYSLGNGQVLITGGPGGTNNVSDPSIVSVGNAGGILRVTLAQASLQFGFGFALLGPGAVPDGTTIALFSGAAPVGSLVYAAAPDPVFSGGFAGIESTTAFDRVELAFNAEAIAWAVDNVRVTPVPEPSALALFALGGLVLALRRGRGLTSASSAAEGATRG